MFGRRTLQNEYAKAIAEIDNGHRRQPHHDVPVALRKHGDVDPVDQFAFEEFAWFGATLDWSTDDAWSFEETSDTTRRASYLDSPDHGRRWLIYYNALPLGWIEVSASPIKPFCSVDEFRASPQARIDMKLSLMRFIPTDAAEGILYQSAFYMQSIEDGYDAARARARVEAQSAMTRYMWSVMCAQDEYIPILEFSAEGSYAVFREAVARWKENGYNPFRHKGWDSTLDHRAG